MKNCDFDLAKFCAENLEAEGDAIKKYDEVMTSLHYRCIRCNEIIENYENPTTTEDGVVLDFGLSDDERMEEYERAKTLLPKIESFMADIREIISDEKNHAQKLLKNMLAFDNIEANRS